MDKGQRFEKIGREFFLEWARRHPVLGTALGLHEECDERMPVGSREKIQDDVRFLKRYEAEFSHFDPKTLSPAQAVDRELALERIRFFLFERTELPAWERIPDAALVLGEALFQLLSRNFAPLSDRLRSILKRLEGVETYLEEVRTKLRDPVKIYIENELETITRLPGIFNTLKAISWDNLPKAPQRQFLKLIETAQNALEKYSDWLIVDVLPECREDFPIGEKALKAILAARGISSDPRAILAEGEAEMRRNYERLREIGKKIKRKVSVEDIRELIRQQHPDNFDGALRFCRDQAQRAKQFVVRSGFAQLPPEEGLFVVETPAYLRHLLPHGTYAPPARMEKKRDAYFYVTPGDCDSDKLKEHNYAALANLTLRETYPGRHLQAIWTLENPSLLRSLPPDPTATEGWSLYCEERVRELGYDDTPPVRFMSVLSAHFRAARAVMDVRIARGDLSVKAGVEFLIDHVGMDRVAAEAELRKYIMAPGEALSGMPAREAYKELKKWVRERMKARFSESFFHTSVLQAGPLHPNLLKHELAWRVEEHLKRPAKGEPEAIIRDVAKPKSTSPKKAKVKKK